MMFISIINRSTNVSNTDVATMTEAIQKQVILHFLPAWNLKQCTVKFFADETKAPGHSAKIYLVDDDAAAGNGALGFHEETGTVIDGYIMTKVILSNGGGVLAFDTNNPGQYTVSGTLSHEVLECIMDRFTNVFCDNGSISQCQEMCDPVEQIGYGVDVNGTLVSVSDFCFPAYFNPDAVLPQNAPLNYLNTLTAPFTILAGGYAITRKGGPGSEVQTFGAMMPMWRRESKSKRFARMQRRKNIIKK